MNTTRLLLSLGASASILATSLVAQTRTDQLLAFVRSGGKTGSYAAMQNMPGGCKTATKLASTLNGKSSADSGGAAYDPTTDSMWISDGVKIRNQTMAGKSLCEFSAVLNGKGWFVSGLAFKRSSRQLIQLETGPASSSGTPVLVRTYDTKKCPAVAQKVTCKSFKLGGTGRAAAGLAYDDSRDFLYVSTSGSGLVSSFHEILVSRLATPCTKLNTSNITVNNCSKLFSTIRGLGYSDCSQTLYVTFGDETRHLRMLAPAAGSYTDLTTANNKGVCCKTGLGTSDTFAGLAVAPGYDSKVVGNSCVAKSCGACNAMTLSLTGVPIIGNQSFGFAINNAPSGSSAFFYISVGACAAKPLDIGLCAPIHPAVGAGQPLMLAVLPVVGNAACNGTATLNTPLPLLTGLCNLTLCTQWFIKCKPSGSGLTNAIQFKIGG